VVLVYVDHCGCVISVVESGKSQLANEVERGFREGINRKIYTGTTYIFAFEGL